MPERALTFGPYEVLGRLASGLSSHTLLGKRTVSDGVQRLVCIKMLLPVYAEDDRFSKRFLAEARLAAHLSHPSCIAISDLGRVAGAYFVATDYVPGATLQEVLDQSDDEPIDAEATINIITAVCEGIHHAHGLRDDTGRPFSLVHRDLSPRNILLSCAGEILVTDFGIVKPEVDQIGTKSNLLGRKYRYMSPEQLSGEPIDHRSDIYSLGLVLFECLTARHPFGALSLSAAVKAMTLGAPNLKELKETIDPNLDAVCARALHPQKEERFDSAEQMAEALRASLQHRGRSVVLELLEQRMENQLEERWKVAEQLVAGHVDAAVLERILGAAPMTKFDLDATDSVVPSLQDTAPSQPLPSLKNLVAGIDIHSLDALSFDDPIRKTLAMPLQAGPSEDETREHTFDGPTDSMPPADHPEKHPIISDDDEDLETEAIGIDAFPKSLGCSNVPQATQAESIQDADLKSIDEQDTRIPSEVAMRRWEQQIFDDDTKINPELAASRAPPLGEEDDVTETTAEPYISRRAAIALLVLGIFLGLLLGIPLSLWLF